MFIALSWLSGAAKVAFGIGGGVLLTPIAALVLPPKVAIALMAPMMIITDFVALPHHWRKWSIRDAAVLLPTACVGVVLGSIFLAWAPPIWVRRAVGLVALFFVASQLWKRVRPSGPDSRPMPEWLGYPIGFLAGLSSSVAHAGGIVMSIYLLSIGLKKQTFVATIIACFFVTDTTKLLAFWQTGLLTWQLLLAGTLFAPAMLLGGSAGAFLHKRLTVDQFTNVVMVLVGLSGVLLLIGS